MNLVLHIGTEKTGTTLLQNWVYSNREYLSGQGIFLSDRIGKFNNRDIVALFRRAREDYWNTHNLRTQQDKDRHFDGFLDGFEQELREAERTHHTIIITSEHFHSRLFLNDEVGAFADFCQRNFSQVKIICYIRPQWDVRKSRYSSAIRHNGTETIEDFGSDIKEDDPYYNYYDLYMRWRNNFRGASLDFRVYDRWRFRGADIRRDFIDAWGLNLDESGLNFSVASANESVKLLKAHALIALNKEVPYFVAGGVDRRNQAYKDILKNAGGLDQGELHDNMAATVCEIFRESNRKLSIELFGREDLFPEPEPQYRPEEVMPISAVAALVEEVVQALVSGTMARLLADDDINLLRDVALKYERQEKLTREQAIGLMAIAGRARPAGSLIERKLQQWRAGE